MHGVGPPYQNFGEGLHRTDFNNAMISVNSRVGKVKKWERVPDSSWKSLAQLIRQLPALADLSWNCSQSVSPCVLIALQEHALRRRLWINTFQFRNLHGPALDAHEVRLMTSPCLYAIRLDFLTAWPSKDGTETMHAYDEEAVMRLVAGMAPGLRKVSLSPRPPFAMPRYTPKLPWEGFNTTVPLPPFTPGTLRTLRIENRGLSTESLDAPVQNRLHYTAGINSTTRLRPVDI